MGDPFRLIEIAGEIALMYPSIMRKWLRIAVALLLLLALFLVPRDEIGVHKRKCQGAYNALMGKSVTQRISAIYYKLTKGTPRTEWQEETYDELQSSREALVELGYLVRQPIRLEHTDGRRVRDEFALSERRNAFVWCEVQSRSSLISVVAPRNEIAGLTNWVLGFDVYPVIGPLPEVPQQPNPYE
jgi:hypothetical protein